MNIKVLGIDLAKHIFQVHGIDASGKESIKKKMTREELLEFIMKLPPCIIGM
jgi:transposase